MKKPHKYYAFFDVDNTVVKIKTMRSFLKYFYTKKHRILGKYKYKLYQLGATCYKLLGVKREFSNKRYYTKFTGHQAADIKALCDAWFNELENDPNNIFIKDTLQEIEWHKANGGEIVFVSGSFEWCLEPIAKKLGVENLLSTKPQVDNGVCTGEIMPPQTIGKGKVQAIKNFLNERAGDNVDLNTCYAYGDHISDLPMLNYVGNPYVIKGDANLEFYANQRDWPVLSNC